MHNTDQRADVRYNLLVFLATQGTVLILVLAGHATPQDLVADSAALAALYTAWNRGGPFPPTAVV